jgi:hypothetical protein
MLCTCEPRVRLHLMMPHHDGAYYFALCTRWHAQQDCWTNYEFKAECECICWRAFLSGSSVCQGFDHG